MNVSYGVVWREDALPLATGKLELLPHALRFEGIAGGRPTTHEIAYETLAAVRVGRSPSERLDGRPSLVLERRSGLPISVASVVQSGVVAEIAERLASLHFGANARRRTVFVLPLREGAHDRAQALLAEGPPFDPEETALDRHDVFVTQNEVVFVFESKLGVDALEPLLSDPALWLSAAAWRELLAGPPRIAEDAYSWERPPAANGSGSR
ncbi:MAG TPA: hypothetical protein VF101_03465 [Gaiellaceae bacterium]